MAGRKVRFSAAKVVSKRRTTGTSPGAKVCYGDTGHAQPSLQNGAVQLSLGRLASWKSRCCLSPKCPASARHYTPMVGQLAPRHQAVWRIIIIFIINIVM